MKSLLTRTITGLVYGLLLVGSVILHPLAFLVVYIIITLLTLYEFYSLARGAGIYLQIIAGIFTGAAIFLITFLHNYYGISSGWYLLIPIFIIIILISELFRKKENPFISLSVLFMGLIYIVLPLTLINLLLFSSYSTSYSFELLIFLFMVLWVYDTGAYLTGSIIGRKKLYERLSPKKTWEGLIGGMALALIANAAFGGFFDQIPVMDRWLLAIVIIISGTFGDLFESMWKRSLGIKDSGKSLPGHGGWLDRLDSILFAVPSVYLTVEILKLL